MKTVLSIAGSDPSGGAGIQADIKTMTLNGVSAMSAVTALTAQNTIGVRAIEEVSADLLKEQIDCVFEDIYPDAVKIGMVSSKELIETIAERLDFFKAENIVVDPVMAATSGSLLLKTDAVDALIKYLFPISTIVTPNIPEAEVLSGMEILNEKDMKKAAEKIGRECSCAVLIKGGHSINDADDILFSDDEITVFKGRRIGNPNTHGTGCTLSSAIACNLAKGTDIPQAVKRAKEYITGAIGSGLDLGHGRGPLDHGYDIRTKFKT